MSTITGKKRTIYEKSYVFINNQEYNPAYYFLNAFWLKIKNTKLPWYGAEVEVALKQIFGIK
jgi:hypothetical protein